MTAQEFIAQLEQIVVGAETAITIVEKLVPNVEVDAALATAAGVLPVLEDLLGKAVTAWSTASGQAITVDSVKALLPDQTPLTPPKS